MAKVTIYTKEGCPFSTRAIEMLEEKGISYDEISITGSAERRAEMMAASGGHRTTPQILIDGEPLGGADDLEEADRAGRLASMLLAPAPAP